MKLRDCLVLSLLGQNVFLTRGAVSLLTNVLESKPGLEHFQIIKDIRIDKLKRKGSKREKLQ